MPLDALHPLAALCIGFYLAEGAGYLVHRLLHWPGSGALYEGHMDHHRRLYPPGDLLSDVYRTPSPGASAVILFAPFFVALVLAALITLPLGTAILVVIELAVLAWLNNYLHDGMHVRGFWLERFGCFRRLRELHFQHHAEMSSNLGIFVFVFDHLLATYRDPAIGRRARS